MIEKLLRDNEDAVREAGKELVEIGKELADGKIQEVLDRLKKANQKHKDWEELDAAIVDVEAAIQDRKTLLAVRCVLEDLLGVVLAAAIKGALMP